MFFRKLTILGSVALLVSTLGCSAGRQHKMITEQTDLSGIADKYFQLFLTPDRNSRDRLHFVVCPSEKTLDSNMVLDERYIQACVEAFLDENGKSVTFPRQVVEKSHFLKEGDNLSDGGYQHFLSRVARPPATAILTVAASVVGGIILTVSLPRLAHPSTLKHAFSKNIVTSVVTLTSLAVGGEALKVGSKTKAQRCVRALNNLDTSTAKLAAEPPNVTSEEIQDERGLAIGSQGSTAVLRVSSESAPTLQALKQIRETIASDCVGYRADWWVNESLNVSLVDSFSDIVDTNPNYVRTVSTRIPDLMPVLSNFITQIGWATEGQIVWQCLPKAGFSPFYPELNKDTDSLCALASDRWETGSRALYKRPKSVKSTE
ncbi:MAG: hypothetical protein OXC44_08230 [Proteobacteria bacterium]|nr:hypothetical protein [Pseudomonadota bacterium]